MGASELERKVTIALVENQSVVVDGVRAWVGNDPEGRAEIVAVGATIEEALDGPGKNADVIVLDLELGTPDSGLHMATPRVPSLCADGYRVVVFSVHLKPLIIHTVIQAGASAVLDKYAERDQFVDTVVAAGRDEPFVTPSMAGGMLHSVHLSEREQQALQCLFQGMKHDSIAARLRKQDGKPISAATVKEYINRARAKFAATGAPCRSNYALLARCIDFGLIRPEEITDYRATASNP